MVRYLGTRNTYPMLRQALRQGSAAMLLGLFALPTISAAQAVPDCGFTPEQDTNGDGYSDRLVAVDAILIRADVGCFSTIRSRAIVVLAEVVDDSEVGERTFLAPGARLSRAVIGERSIVLNDSEIIGGLGIDKPRLGDRIFLGPNVRVSGRAQLSDGAVVLRGSRIDEGDFSTGLVVGTETELTRVTTGTNVRIGSRTRIDFNTMLGSETTIGNEVNIGIVTGIAERVQVGERTEIGQFVDIGADSLIGTGVTIGDRASLGTGVVVGSDASIADDAVVPDFTEITAGSAYP